MIPRHSHATRRRKRKPVTLLRGYELTPAGPVLVVKQVRRGK